MKVTKAKFKKAKAKRKTGQAIAVELPVIEVAQGLMIATGNTKQEMDATYRAIRSELLSRRGQKHRIIRLLKSFLIYRTK
jgi:hypothetical protein